MKLKLPEKLIIASYTFKMVYDDKCSGGSVDFGSFEMKIGTELIKKSPNTVFMVICHEVAEAIHIINCTRYDDTSVIGNYMFFQDHKQFDNHICLFAQTIQEFIV